MSLVERSMRHPVTVSMLTLAAGLFGFVSLTRLPWSLLPDISYPSLTIRTEYPDSAPAEVENLITEPLEEAVAVVHGLRSLRSSSRAGLSEITLEFAWDTAMDYSALDVREKIDLVELPDDAKMPVLLRYDPNLDPILRLGLYGDKDLVTLRYLAERVMKKDLESLEGVASVRVRGGLEEEILVEVDEGKLAAMGIPISSVSQFIQSQNVNASGGSLRDREAEFLVRTVNEYESLEEISRTVLFEETGRRVTLGDVATVERSFRDREVVSRVRGQEAVELAIFKEGDANTVQVARALDRRLERLKRSLPEGVHTQVLFDQSTFIENSVSEVRSNAILGGLLAVFVLYLFLRDRRSTAIIALTIPISIVATFLLMQQLGVSLNIMSLGGLALGVGNMMDNAIVVLEAVNRHRAQGKPIWEATRDGAGEVAGPVTASTLTTVAVFLPIVFVEGIAGQIFRDQALTVAASQIISLAAALTLIPVLMTAAARRGKEIWATDGRGPGALAGQERVHNSSPRRFRRILAGVGRVVLFPLLWLARILTVVVPGWALRFGRLAATGLIGAIDFILRPVQAAFDRIWNAFSALYPRILLNALQHRGRTLALTLGLTALAVLLVPALGIELVPQFSQGEFAFDLEWPSGTPLGITESRVREIEKGLAQDPRLRIFFASVGESPEMGSARAERRENVAQLNLAMRNPGNASEEAAMIEDVRESLASHPDLRYTFRRPTYFSFQTPVEIQVFGHDLELVGQYTDALVEDLSQMKGVRDLRSSLEEGSPEVQVAFRRDRLAAFDLDLETVSRTLRHKIRGEVATKFKERDRQLDILVRAAQAASIDIGQVENLVVSEVDGVPIPLSSVADVAIGRGPAEIHRIGQQRAAVIRAELVGRDLGSASQEIREILRANPPPPSLLATLGGQDEEVSVAYRSLLLAAGLAIFMVYLVMASEFESFLHPMVILLTVPLGLVGVILTLFVTGTAVSVVVMIGVILLCGIVVNNAIVLIDFVNQRRREGLAKLDALMDAAQARLRPILMTTLTTVLGLVPMAVGLGEGAEIRAPMAIAVIGGLSLATLLTLVVIPVVYATLDRTP